MATIRSTLRLDGYQCSNFLVRKKTCPCEEAQAGSVVQGKHSALSGYHVDDQLSVLPILELSPTYVERCSSDITKADVAVTDDKAPLRIAHGRRPVATRARLVEHHRTVLPLQALDQRFSRRQRLYPWHGHHTDPRDHLRLEKSRLFRAVADQHVLRLLIML